MEIKKVSIDILQPWVGNPRTHQAELGMLIKSISHYGWTNPILVQAGSNRVIAGHGRIEAAKRLGIEEVPVIFLEMDDKDADAYTVADNRLAELSEWDRAALKDILESLDDGEFDMDLTGFDEAALEELLTAAPPEVEILDPQCDEDETPELPKEAITKPGDLIILGRHRLLCGDSTSITDVERLMDGKKADFINTDPPYGVSFQSNMRTKSEQFSVLENDDKILDVAPVLWGVMGEDTAAIVWTSQQVYPLWRAQFEAFYKSTVIWFKGGGGMGDLQGDFAPDYEMALFCVKGRPTLQGKRHGAVWQIGKDLAADYQHPTQKPVALAEFAMEALCKPRGRVVDLFGGAGFTMLAAEKTGRIAYLMELDPKYCDVIVERWEKYTGKKAERP